MIFLLDENRKERDVNASQSPPQMQYLSLKDERHLATTNRKIHPSVHAHAYRHSLYMQSGSHDPQEDTLQGP